MCKDLIIILNPPNSGLLVSAAAVIKDKSQKSEFNIKAAVLILENTLSPLLSPRKETLLFYWIYSNPEKRARGNIRLVANECRLNRKGLEDFWEPCTSGSTPF